MTAGYNGVSASSQLYLGPTDTSAGINYNDKSSKLSAGATLSSNGYQTEYGENRNAYILNPFPIHNLVPAAATGLIPVEVMPIKLDIASSYETQDRGRKNSRDVPPLVLSRRRAQNRASQRAYRDRRDKKIRETEEKITERQGRYYALTQAFETLKLEYLDIKKELESLQSQHKRGSPVRRNLPSYLREWDEFREENTDPLMFPASVFYYNAEGDGK